jgi:hypothetical protein
MRYVAFPFMWSRAGNDLMLLNTEPARGPDKRWLEGVQERHQLPSFAPGFLSLGLTRDLAHRQRFGLHLKICFCVYVRGVKGNVAKPRTNRVDVYAGTH